jgi:hypothetical protein
MGKFVKDPNPYRPCGGPCGRITRSTRTTVEAAEAAGHYGTVMRHGAGGLCGACTAEAKADAAAAQAAKEAAAKSRLAGERLAAAEKVRMTMLQQRAARAKARMVKPVGLGQSMVRI